jgi:ClpP class serine protease
VNDSEEVLRAIRLTDEDVPLHIILNTPGGLVLTATQIARAIRDRKSRVTVFVPHYAMSDGTLIALAADEIVMSPARSTWPINPQLEKFAAASLLKVLEQKPVEKIDWPMSVGKRSRRSIRRPGICSRGVSRTNRPTS